MSIINPVFFRFFFSKHFVVVMFIKYFKFDLISRRQLHPTSNSIHGSRKNFIIPKFPFEVEPMHWFVRKTFFLIICSKIWRRLIWKMNCIHQTVNKFYPEKCIFPYWVSIREGYIHLNPKLIWKWEVSNPFSLVRFPLDHVYEVKKNEINNNIDFIKFV